MSFRDEVQIARCCEALCARLRKGRCWTINPAQATAFAIDVLEGKVGLSHGERAVVLAAWAFWNGDRSVSFGELVNTLSREHLEAVLSLASAAAAETSDAVDRWLVMYEARPPVVTKQSGWNAATSAGRCGVR